MATGGKMRAKAFNRKTNSYETLRFIGGRAYNENGDLIQTRGCNMNTMALTIHSLNNYMIESYETGKAEGRMEVYRHEILKLEKESAELKRKLEKLQ